MTQPTNLSAIIAKPVTQTVFPVLLMISFSHLLNDTIQSLISSIYPLVKHTYHLNFSQIGFITLTFQLAASLLQPLVGFYTDKKPQPFSLAVSMGFTFCGLVSLSFAPSYTMVLVSVALIGIGSSVFHPEASKVAYMASGGRRGLAQSIFQVGGNLGSSLGPLLAALIIVTHGQRSIVWFSLLALAAMLVLSFVGKWYKVNLPNILPKKTNQSAGIQLPASKVCWSILILLMLIFSKYFYLSCMVSYFTFYMIEKFHVTVQQSQLYLFAFLFAVAAGTFMGGPLGDRFGRKYVIWFSILGRSAVYPAPALCRTNRFRGAGGADWCNPGLGLFRHPRVCTGTAARQNRYDLRTVFWLRLRHGRPRLRTAGHTRGSHQYRLRIQAMRLPAAAGGDNCLSAEYPPAIHKNLRRNSENPYLSQTKTYFMFDDILALVKEHMGSTPGATPEQTDAMHHEVATHIHDELQNQATAPAETGGGILSQLESNLGGGNVLTGAVAGGLISSLAGKFGLPSAITGAIAGALPGLVQKFMQHQSAPQAGALPA